jgi:hypothetical protein
MSVWRVCEPAEHVQSKGPCCGKRGTPRRVTVAPTDRPNFYVIEPAFNENCHVQAILGRRPRGDRCASGNSTVPRRPRPLGLRGPGSSFSPTGRTDGKWVGEPTGIGRTRVCGRGLLDSDYPSVDLTFPCAASPFISSQGSSITVWTECPRPTKGDRKWKRLQRLSQPGDGRAR